MADEPSKLKLRCRLTDLPAKSSSIAAIDKKCRTRKYATKKQKATLPEKSLNKDGIVMTAQTFSSDLLLALHKLYLEKIGCDVIVSAESCNLIPAHRVVLIAGSGYFRTILIKSQPNDLGNDVVCLPPSITPECLESMILFLYTGSLRLSMENILFMLTTATILDIVLAIQLCHQFLSEHELDLKPDIIKSLSLEQNLAIENYIKQEINQIKEENVTDSWSLLKDATSSATSAAAMLFPDVHTQNPVQKERKKKIPAKKQLKTTKAINKNVNNRGKVKQTKISYQDSDAETVEPIDDFSDSDSPEIEQVKNDVLVSDSPKFERAKRIPKSNRPKKTVSPLKANKNSHLKRKRSDTTEKNEKVVKNNSRIIKKKSRHHPLLGRYLLHKGAGHPCNWCPSSYRFASGLLFHVRTRHNVSLSRLCTARCRKLLHCAKQRTIPSFECKFEDGSENLGNKKFPCLLCSKKFLFRSLLTSHVVKKHFPFRSISTDILDTKTKICLSTDPLKKNQLRNYVKKEEGIKSPTKRRRTKLETVLFCSICSTSLPNENLFKDHMIANHPTVIYQCPHCTFSTRIETVYRRHQSVRHKKRKVCALCGKSCARTLALKLHMYLVHKVQDPAIKAKLFQCPEDGCDYECLSRKRLLDHASRHTELKSFTCDICGKLFKHKIGLERHMTIIHEGIRPFICDVCGLSFGQEGELKLHISRHATNKPFSCDQCTYSTHDKCNLQSHLFRRHKVIVNQKMLILSCDICSFMTNRKGHFRDHMKRHGNICDIPCPDCGKMFTSKKNLYGHVTKVHRPKTLHCVHCSYATSLPNTLKQHMQIMHTHREVKPYECTFCGFRSATRGNCRKHIQRLHMEFQIGPKFVGPPGMTQA